MFDNGIEVAAANGCVLGEMLGREEELSSAAERLGLLRRLLVAQGCVSGIGGELQVQRDEILPAGCRLECLKADLPAKSFAASSRR